MDTFDKMLAEVKKENPKVPTFALMLRAARHLRNWSLREAEKKSGDNISRQTIQRAEHGTAEPETLLRLAKLYKMTKEQTAVLVAEFSKHQLDEAKKAA